MSWPHKRQLSKRCGVNGVKDGCVWQADQQSGVGTGRRRDELKTGKVKIFYVNMEENAAKRTGLKQGHRQSNMPKRGPSRVGARVARTRPTRGSTLPSPGPRTQLPAPSCRTKHGHVSLITTSCKRTYAQMQSSTGSGPISVLRAQLPSVVRAAAVRRAASRKRKGPRGLAEFTTTYV